MERLKFVLIGAGRIGQRHLQYIEEKTNEYLKQLETNDAEASNIIISEVEQKLERLKKNKIN